ncbi:universal stress protein, partial [Streptomyces mirabilis]|uniref:universal stress protein n=1 Tax=Streptomyces mirabilis TaxID=68239 RepID=UPI0036838600
MPRTVTVGLDGSPESRAAADWAAREAKLRGLPLKLVNVWEPVPEPIAPAPLLGPDTKAPDVNLIGLYGKHKRPCPPYYDLISQLDPEQE